MSPIFSYTLLALAATLSVTAQTPAYQGALLLRPASDSNKCLASKNGNVNGSPLVIADCTGKKAQTFTFTGGSIKMYSGTKCVDVVDGNTNDGAKLQIWDCSKKNPNQQFYYGWDNRLSWTDKGKCWDLTNGSLKNGNAIQLWSCGNWNPNQAWNAGYMYNNLPDKSEIGQTGTNDCGTTSSKKSMCQTAWINSVDDFCLWGPPTMNTVGDAERETVAYCSKSGRGARTFPAGTLKGVHFVTTPDYVQVTGVGNFTKINIKKGDDGGELDPHGPDGNGNPVGGLVFGDTFGKGYQYHEWTSFMSDTEFCFRACTGPSAGTNCQHIYDVMGCYWNMPANYDKGVFESCKADNDLPMGIYGTSTWHQGVKPTPSAHPAASSSKCKTLPTVTVSPLEKREIDASKEKSERMRARAPVAFPEITAAPVM